MAIDRKALDQDRYGMIKILVKYGSILAVIATFCSVNYAQTPPVTGKYWSVVVDTKAVSVAKATATLAGVFRVGITTRVADAKFIVYPEGNVFAYQVYETSPVVGDLWMKHYSSVTVINVQDQYETVCGTSSILDSGVTSDFDMPLNNRLRYRNATSSMTMEVFWSGYASPAAGTDLYEVALYKNGVATVIPSESEFDFASQATTLPFAGHTMVTMSQNDYLELWVKNRSGVNDVNIRFYNIIAKPIKIQR